MLQKSDYPTLVAEHPEWQEFIDRWNAITFRAERRRAQLLFWFPIACIAAFISFEVLLGAMTGWENFACNGQGFGRGWLCWGD